ncbi:MAG: DUF4384 domain-containing protein [Cyanothece sp. SIO2G6]|nr:DUF4384 domain-containing protein [Cyanothece sp. SIO2G6]
MTRLRRRHFLQLAGASLGAVALNHIDISHQGLQLDRALAQTTGNKYALLVGINQYPSGVSSLSGCLNDVRLQYELLVHRYGFQPEDIVIVADATINLPAKAIITPPTRQAIIDAWQSHLGQAQPGDTVIFHYSGHGTFAAEPNPITYAGGLTDIDLAAIDVTAPYENFEGKTGAIVPYDVLDGVSPGEANLILGSTLFLLSYGLKTDNVTVILDSCFSGGGVRGNLVYRATLDTEDSGLIQASAAELEFQKTLMAEVGLSPDQARRLREQGIAKGVAMTASLATQTSAETTIAGFRSGIFTYLLTRYLWQSRSGRALEEAFLDLSRITKSEADKLGGAGQNPIYFVQPGTNLNEQPPYLLPPQFPAAEAVVRAVRPESIDFWLGGMTPRGLGEAESIFEVMDSQGNVLGEVRQTQRTGLMGTGEALDGLVVQPGMLMREKIRGIPTDIQLRVGLHQSLGDDLPLVRQVLAGYDRITVVDSDGETESDYLLGRFDGEAVQVVEAQKRGDRPDIQALAPNSIGLFTNGLEPLTTTFGTQFEDMGVALERLAIRLRLLLANQALKAILNTDTSDFQLSVEVASHQRGGVSIVRSLGREEGLQAQVAQLQVGEEMYLKVTNNQGRSLFVAVIAIEQDGDMHVYHPSDWNAPELEAELGNGESVVIPKADDVFCLPVNGPAGFFEVLVIASTEQLRDTLQSLKRISDRSLGNRGQQISFTDQEERSRSLDDSAFSLVENILGDLDRSTPMMRGQYSVETSQLAALTVGVEVVEGGTDPEACKPYVDPF